MKTATTFSIDSFELHRPTREIRLCYSLDGGTPLIETFTLPAELDLPEQDSEELRRLLFALHMAAGVSYYKACCPKNIEIHSGSLTPPEAAFWKDVYEQGLGEFFYRNHIDFRGLIEFPSTGTKGVPPPVVPETIKKVLVPVGGGKDSAVTVELLREAAVPTTLFRVGNHPLIEAFVAETGLPCLTVERTISPELIRLNAEGALNGHVPVTAILSIVALIVARLHGDDAVIMSNESSANDENTEYLGLKINHQWSKSLAFETAFQTYLRQTVGSPLHYFSLIRPLNELQITGLFARYPQYLNICTSCNRNWTLTKQRPEEQWCGECPKCAFVFLLLAAYIDKPPLIEAFGGKNPLNNAALAPLYRELLGLEGFKPFECVGTPTETTAAFLLALEKGQWNNDAIMTMFAAEVLPTITDPHAAIDDALCAKAPHAVPADFLASLHAPR